MLICQKVLIFMTLNWSFGNVILLPEVDGFQLIYKNEEIFVCKQMKRFQNTSDLLVVLFLLFWEGVRGHLGTL